MCPALDLTRLSDGREGTWDTIHRRSTQFLFTTASILTLSWSSYPGGIAAINLAWCVATTRYFKMVAKKCGHGNEPTDTTNGGKLA